MKRLATTLLFSIAILAPRNSAAVQRAPDALATVYAGDARGVIIPAHLPVADGMDQLRTLGEWTTTDRPTLLTLNYMGCPMLCGLQQDGLASALSRVPLTAGKDFHLLSISIDPTETPALARKATTRLSQTVRGPWEMVTAPPDTLHTLTDALDFRYTHDAISGQYAHPAAVYVLSPGGRVTQVIAAIEPHPRDLRLAIVEAGTGTIGSPLDQLLLTCLQYDPDEQSYAPEATQIMRAGGVFVLGGLAVFFSTMWWRERKRTGDTDA